MRLHACLLGCLCRLVLQERAHKAGFFVDVETSNKTLNKKVREGVTAKYNFILVVGEAEEVRVRPRVCGCLGTLSVYLVWLLDVFSGVFQHRTYARLVACRCTFRHDRTFGVN